MKTSTIIASFLLFSEITTASAAPLDVAVQQKDLVEQAIKTGFATGLILPKGQSITDPDYTKPSPAQLSILELKPMKERDGKKCSLLSFMLTQQWSDTGKGRIVVDEDGKPLRITLTLTAPACEGGLIPSESILEFVHARTMKKLEGR